MARAATGSVVEHKGKRATSYSLRFRAYGERRFVTLGNNADGWTRAKAEEELKNVLAAVRIGAWRPPEPEPEFVSPPIEPTFHEFASEWFERHRHEWAPRTVEDYKLSLSHHLLPFFKEHKLAQITAREIDDYIAAKVRGREAKLIDRPLCDRTINKTLTRLGQILDEAVRYDLIDANPMRGKVKKLAESKPRRARMQGDQVRVLLRVAGRNRALLATAIMAGGLRVSELTHLRWGDVDFANGDLRVTASKTDAGVRTVAIEPELAQLLREHKIASKWSRSDDFVFPGRDRRKPRDRNSVRTRVLYPAIERANKVLAKDGRPPIPKGVTFHGLRRTYAALAAERGEHAAITAAQMGHTDPRMTLAVYTDVTGVRPRTTMAGLLDGGADWAEMGRNRPEAEIGENERSPATVAKLRR